MSSSNSNKSLRIISFNSWKGEGDYHKRLELMACCLTDEQPDILCLQESLKSIDGRYDTAAHLAESLGLTSIYTPARRKMRRVMGMDTDCHSGLAILSRYLIKNKHITNLGRYDRDEERIGVTTTIEYPHLPLQITNTHLTHIDSGIGDGQKQLNQLTRCLRTFNPPQNGAWFVCGDFNVELSRTKIAHLQEVTGHCVVDCYKKGGGVLPGTTLVPLDRLKSNRIDYILGVGPSAEKMAITNSRIVLDKKDPTGLHSSDHYGVAIDICVSH